MNKKPLTYLAYAVAAVFVVVAVVYFTTPADKLPAFMPGHNPAVTASHLKHGLAALGLALGAAAVGWFSGGPKHSDDSTAE